MNKAFKNSRIPNVLIKFFNYFGIGGHGIVKLKDFPRVFHSFGIEKHVPDGDFYSGTRVVFYINGVSK